ncbi:galactose mutarotase [Streptomyces sp. ICN988]|uniref:aldose epimerase family protein n=1 Tax=Streptomyces TaxID=1883 RepID=UPI000C9B1781|nr:MULTISPECIES: aldose epimerase family protein [Streptomyces]MCQ4204610.1 galactose mutarotase [Streptomyces coelicoflavus]MCV2463295.1 galactose mutarotase [Streptomyces sp. ICN988]MDU0253722.1 aldose epimerase family protein [Streptomyces sp. PU10]NDZ74358.1 galactose mutarotase [Streptomyces sp. SID10362]WKX21244.1 aldose epimerase family protein [Streptomyces sp. HUAS CX7]
MSELFGTLSDGTPVHRWTLERAGVRVRVLSYGGIVQSAEVPDRDGNVADVVLGFADLDGYLRHPEPYLGALVGRYANRIAGGRFPLDGRTYAVVPNEGPNTLHGGERGFDKRVWDVEAVTGGVRLSRVSPHGEEGFPGRLEMSATYTLDGSGALRIGYEAVTDAPTVLNPTNHSYFNLSGSGHAGGHELRLAASRITPVDAGLIPTGGLDDVTDTRFDFRRARKIGSGYDHNFVLDKGVTDAAEEVAELYDPASGRVLTVATTEPGLQLYTADHLGEPFAPGDGVALETQHFPDSPNRPGFPSTVLRPGEVFRSETVYRFSVR